MLDARGEPGRLLLAASAVEPMRGGLDDARRRSAAAAKGCCEMGVRCRVAPGAGGGRRARGDWALRGAQTKPEEWETRSVIAERPAVMAGGW